MEDHSTRQFFVMLCNGGKGDMQPYYGLCGHSRDKCQRRLPAPSFHEQMQSAKSQAKGSNILKLLLYLVKGEPNSHHIATSKRIQQVTLKRGEPAKKLTYLHDKRTNAKQYLSSPLNLMYGTIRYSKTQHGTSPLTGLCVVTSLLATSHSTISPLLLFVSARLLLLCFFSYIASLSFTVMLRLSCLLAVIRHLSLYNRTIFDRSLTHIPRNVFSHQKDQFAATQGQHDRGCKDG
jgi:hypothetical protein